MRNPKGPTRWSGDWVAAQIRAMFPVFGGISGSRRTIWNGGSSGGTRRGPTDGESGLGGTFILTVSSPNL